MSTRGLRKAIHISGVYLPDIQLLFLFQVTFKEALIASLGTPTFRLTKGFFFLNLFFAEIST